MSVCRLFKFDNNNLLSFISCLQATHDAIYFTYKPSYANGALDTAHHAHVHDFGVYDPPDDVEVFPIVADDMDDDGWEDDDSEDEDPMGMGAVENDGQYLEHLSSPITVLTSIDPVHAIINNWFMPIASNTVYSVNF